MQHHRLMRAAYRLTSLALGLFLTGCDSVTGSTDETEYQGSLSGQLVQKTDHGNSVVCTSTHAVTGTLQIKLRSEGERVRGSGEASATAATISVDGPEGFCFVSSTPPLTYYFGGEVSGTLKDIQWSQTQSESTTQSSSTQTLSFTGSASGAALNGTLVLTQENRRTVVNCTPTTGCTPPRTVVSTVSWTTNISATAQ